MKKLLFKTATVALVLFFAGFSIIAQEKEKEVKKEVKKIIKNEDSKFAVKVLKDGETVIDTVYMIDENFDKKKIEAMVEELGEDGKTINIFKKGDKDAMVYNFEFDSEDMKEGQYEVIKKMGEGEEVSTVIIKKKMQEGEECDENEVEVEVMVVEGEEGVHKFHTKGGNVVFFGDNNEHKMKEGNVFITEGKNSAVWTTDENELIELDELKAKKGNMMFFAKEKKGHISLDLRDDGLYRLGFDSDELEPIQIEVFDSEGNRLFKKKVKNFYGRFLKDIDLGNNETGLYTVRVLQGEKEIIGEFEYK